MDTRRARAAAVTVLTLFALILTIMPISGCSQSGKVAPGYTAGSDGTAVVVGYLGRSQLEGGFWAVYKTLPSNPDAATDSLAVLLPGSVSDQEIMGYNGRYIRASGKVSTGPSTRMSGPEIAVDKIEAVPEP